MFEFEIDHKRASSQELPEATKALFKDPGADIAAVALLGWEEHCTDCAAPQCYTTCDLYEARKDAKCRRFVHGIQPVLDAPTIQNYLVQVAFKRWSLLKCYANVHMVSASSARRLENAARRLEEMIARMPGHRLSIKGRRGLATRLYRRFKGHALRLGLFARETSPPDYFLVEIYNPNPTEVRLSLTIRNLSSEPQNIPYQQLLALTPGFHRYKFAYREIAAVIDFKQNVEITLDPNILSEEHEGLELCFGMLTFVTDGQYESGKQPSAAQDPNVGKAATTVKVVAWDLDNTVWDGTLVEDGREGVALKAGIPEIIRELDRRGIINTVVSKNNPDEAIERLKAFGLYDYFLFAKIGWEPKGVYIKQLIRDFNVGEDTIAFIDDSAFERAQVLSMNPKVRAMDAAAYDTLLERREFNPPVTTEASRRREFYLNQKKRVDALQGFEGDYVAFLQKCQIVLSIDVATQANVERIHELVQRTNQLNFSGHRYQRSRIEAMLVDDSLDLYVMECSDRFGDYGVIGFAVVERAIPRLVDLMFSCRIQAKRVEHAFLCFLLCTYKSRGSDRLEATFRATPRNAKAGMVFKDLDFQHVDCVDSVDTYNFDLSRPISCDGLIDVRWKGKSYAF